MKIRIKGASVRLRLSKSEVAKITSGIALEERTPFLESAFIYSLETTTEGSALSAAFRDGKMTMYVPKELIHDWETNGIVSIESDMPLKDGSSLYLLLEKDFQCLDQTTEDQSDNYINPNKNC